MSLRLVDYSDDDDSTSMADAAVEADATAAAAEGDEGLGVPFFYNGVERCAINELNTNECGLLR